MKECVKYERILPDPGNVDLNNAIECYRYLTHNNSF